MIKLSDILMKIKNIKEKSKKVTGILKKSNILPFPKSVVITILIGLFFGLFLLFYKFALTSHNKENPQNVQNGSENSQGSHQGNSQPQSVEDVVIHKRFDLKINGLEQVINILEIDIGTDKAKVKPVLSHNSVYGFELLSEMAERHKAYAAVNAGFFYEYGEPSGMVVTDGEIITGSTGKYPVFSISEGKAEIKQFETEMFLESDSKGTQTAESSETNLPDIKVNKINVEGKPGEWILYTRRFGTDNRVKQDNITIIIENNTIKEIIESEKETQIPDEGMLATYIKPSDQGASLISQVTVPFTKDEKVKFVYKPYLGKDGQAYECGSWIIRDREIVIGEKDPWVGVLTNRDPRTAIGIKESGDVVLITADGRQPGYSYGLTARELGEFLLELGVKDAAMLDGGASSEMIIKGEIINRPSFRASERPLAGAVIIVAK